MAYTVEMASLRGTTENPTFGEFHTEGCRCPLHILSKPPWASVGAVVAMLCVAVVVYDSNPKPQAVHAMATNPPTMKTGVPAGSRVGAARSGLHAGKLTGALERQQAVYVAHDNAAPEGHGLSKLPLNTAVIQDTRQPWVWAALASSITALVGLAAMLRRTAPRQQWQPLLDHQSSGRSDAHGATAEDSAFVAQIASELAAGKLPSEKDDPLVLAVASGVLMLASSVGHRLDGLACPLSAGSQNIALATTSGEMPEMASVREEPSVADLMAFNGILPETINGRAAQLGFVAGLASELQTGQTMVQQIASNPIAVPVVAGLVTLASLMPKLRGAQRYNVDPRSRSGGTWNARSELVNGRAAMLGLFLALVQEALTGTPLLG
jgi:hypothetical protein